MPGVSRALREVIAAMVAASLAARVRLVGERGQRGRRGAQRHPDAHGREEHRHHDEAPERRRSGSSTRSGRSRSSPARTRSATSRSPPSRRSNGYITRMRPDLTYMDGTVPRVDVLHLHHGVWVNLSRPNTTNNLPELFFAAGEEKTIFQLPKGYGYRYEASDGWLLNHMIHNLTPIAKEVKMVYEIDFIPDSSPAAKNMKPARPIWMDVESGKTLPGLQRPEELGQEEHLHLPERRPERLSRGPPAQRLDRRPRRRSPRHRRPPASRRPAHRPLAAAQRRQGAGGQVRQGQDGQGRQEVPSQVATRQGRQGPPVQVGRPSTSSPPARCRGTWP